MTSPSPLDCLNTCTTEYLSIRPEYDEANDQYVYECSCWEDQVQGGQNSDCGFGIEAVYRKAWVVMVDNKYWKYNWYHIRVLLLMAKARRKSVGGFSKTRMNY